MLVQINELGDNLDTNSSLTVETQIEIEGIFKKGLFVFIVNDYLVGTSPFLLTFSFRGSYFRGREVHLEVRSNIFESVEVLD